MFEYKKSSFKKTMEALGRSKNTIRAYVSDLDLYFDKYENITESCLQQFVIDLSGSGLSPSSIRRYLSSIRTYCNIFGISINFSIIQSPKLLNKESSYITEDVFTSGIEHILFDNSTSRYSKSFRCAVFNILYSTGIRVAELLSLTPSSYDKKTKILCVLGKGNKLRRIPAQDTLFDVLCNDSFFERLEGLSVSTVSYWTKKYFGEEFSPHSFRHGFTTKLINNGAKNATVQKVLGHESFTTTLRYFHMNMDEVVDDFNKALNMEE